MRHCLIFTAASLVLPGLSPALAQDEEESIVAISGHVEIVSDYRLRGVSQTGKDPTIQGGIDLGIGDFYIGTWGSGIDDLAGAGTEIDIYGGYVFNLGAVSLDLGAIGYLYPGGNGVNYVELSAKVSGEVGGVGLSATAFYAPSQSNLGSTDNIYIVGGVDYPIPNTNLALSATLGLEDGFFGNNKIDWSLGVSYQWKSLTLTAAYVDTDTGLNIAKGGAVLSIGTAF